ncbi:MAG: type II secretion system protein [Rhodocyclales bacterium]|nr:type II secretion system protein [Rhodocyclales bacterium]
MSRPFRQRGISLIETILFMVIVGVAVGGVMGVFMATTRSSADPLVRKQALAIAESLLEEVRLMPFTFCDPDDPNVSTATSAVVGVGPTFCAVAAETAMAPEAGETRYSAATPFDNVNDYNGFDTATAVPAGICDISGACIAALAGYRAQVAVAATAFNGIPAADALLITVTVIATNGETISLSGVRTRYAPNL